MKTASKWAKDLRLTLGMALRQPEPLLGTGQTVLEATLSQVQIEVLEDLLIEARKTKSPWLEQCIHQRLLDARTYRPKVPVDKVLQAA
jgi:hypothetical protein